MSARLDDVRVDVRPNDDGTIDEVFIHVGDRCLFHLEQMDTDAYWFGIYPTDTDDRWSFWIGRKGKKVVLNEEERP